MHNAFKRAHAAEILLVEDNSGDVELTKIVLDKSRFVNRLHVVRDGEQALDYLYRRGKFFDAPRPDIILLDFHMPRKTGKEVLATIRADAALQDIVVVIFSGSSAEKELFKDAGLRVEGYILKPLKIEQLMDVIGSLEQFGVQIVKARTKRA